MRSEGRCRQELLCTTRKRKVRRRKPAQEIFDKYRDQGAVMVDLKDVYCPDGMCSP